MMPGRVLPGAAIPPVLVGLAVAPLAGLGGSQSITGWSLFQAAADQRDQVRPALCFALLAAASVLVAAVSGPRDKRPLAVFAALSFAALIVELARSFGVAGVKWGFWIALFGLVLLALGAWAAPIEWEQIRTDSPEHAKAEERLWPFIIAFLIPAALWFSGILRFGTALAVLAVAIVVLAFALRDKRGRAERSRSPPQSSA